MYEFLMSDQYVEETYLDNPIKIKLLTSEELSIFQSKHESDHVEAIKYLLETSLPGLGDVNRIPIRHIPKLASLILKANGSDPETEANAAKN